MSDFERELLSDLSGQRRIAELGYFRLRAPGARRARSGGGSAAGKLARHRPGLRRRSAACHPSLRERTRTRRARERLTFDEAVGLQWALVQRRHGELSSPVRRRRRGLTGLAAELLRRLPFELTAGQREVLDVIVGRTGCDPADEPAVAGGGRFGQDDRAVLAMLQMVDAGYQCALLAPTEVLAAQHVRSITEVLGPLAMGGQLGGADDAARVALLTGSMTTAQKK